MYRISKQFTFEASHKLHLPYPSKCSHLHGHSYTVTLWLEATNLDSNGMVKDYVTLDAFKAWIDEHLDHKHLNDVMKANPTAETIAKFIYDWAVVMVETDDVKVYMIEVKETAKTCAQYGRIL